MFGIGLSELTIILVDSSWIRFESIMYCQSANPHQRAAKRA